MTEPTCPFFKPDGKLCTAEKKRKQGCGGIWDIYERCHVYKHAIKFAKIHPSVEIPEDIILGNNVTIKKGTIIEKNVTIEDNVDIGYYCIILEGSIIQRNVSIRPFTVIDKGYFFGFDGDVAYL